MKKPPITLPLFPEDELRLGGLWVTKRQLQRTILELFPALVEKSRIHSTFNGATGKVNRKYAWNSVYNDINRAGLARKVIAAIKGDKEEKSPYFYG